MQYRRLGRSGLQLSELSLGSWVTYHNQVDTSAATEMLAAAMDAGINFFDNAEGYAQGHGHGTTRRAFALASAGNSPGLRRSFGPAASRCHCWASAERTARHGLRSADSVRAGHHGPIRRRGYGLPDAGLPIPNDLVRGHRSAPVASQRLHGAATRHDGPLRDGSNRR